MAGGSPVDRLGCLLPRVSRGVPLLPQLRVAADAQRDDAALDAVRQGVTSEPGRAAALLRELFYAWLDLPEPGHPAATRAIPVPRPEPVFRQLPYVPAMFFATEAVESAEATEAAGRGLLDVWRFPAAVQRGQRRHLAGAHLAADPDDPDPRWARAADLLLVPRERGQYRGEDGWNRLVARFPGCGAVAFEEEGGGCALRLGDGRWVRVRWSHGGGCGAFAVAASAGFGWVLGLGRSVPARVGVRVGWRGWVELSAVGG